MIDLFNLLDKGISKLPDEDYLHIEIKDQDTFRIVATYYMQLILKLYFYLDISEIANGLDTREEHTARIFPGYVRSRRTDEELWVLYSDAALVIRGDTIYDEIDPILEYTIYIVALKWSNLLYEQKCNLLMPEESGFSDSEELQTLYEHMKSYLLVDDDEDCEAAFDKCHDAIFDNDIAYRLFDDYDFLPEYLRDIVNGYVEQGGNPEGFDMRMGTDLTQYILLMDDETLARFNNTQKKFQDAGNNSKDAIRESIALSLHTQQSTYGSNRLSENQLNDQLRNNLLVARYQISDQSRHGESKTGKDAGHPDLIIYHEGWTVAIIEALKVKGEEWTIINEHLDRLMENYNPTGCRQLYLVIYVSVDSLDSFCHFLREKLDDRFKYSSRREIPFDHANIKGYEYEVLQNGTYVYLNVLAGQLLSN